MKKILLKNSLSGIIQLIITTLLTLITIPVFIKLLGEVRYGLFAAISVIGNLNQFSNLGLNTTLTKFIAEQGKTRQSDHDILVTIILLTAVILPVSVLAWGFSNFLLIEILKIPQEYLQESKSLFLLLVASNFLLLIGQCFVSVINALQKMYISNMLRLVYSILYWGLILVMLAGGFSLVHVGLSILVAASIFFILVLSFFLKLWGIPRFKGIQRNFKITVKKQFFYSLKIYTSGLLSFCFNPLTKILISNFIGLAQVGYYDISLRVSTTFLRLLTKPMEALYPMQAQLKDRAKSRVLVHDIEQKSFFFIMPLIIGMIFIMKPLIHLWLGYENNYIIYGTIWIGIFYLIGLTTTPNYQFLFAKGYASNTVYMQVFNVLINTVVFFLTFKILGFYAAVMANCLAILSSFSLNLYFQKKYLSSLIFDTPNQFIRYILAAIITFIIVYSSSFIIYEYFNQLQQIIAYAIITLTATVLSYRFLKIITEADIKRYFSVNVFLEKTFRRLFIR